jgi:hypothetical protein
MFRQQQKTQKISPVASKTVSIKENDGGRMFLKDHNALRPVLGCPKMPTIRFCGFLEDFAILLRRHNGQNPNLVVLSQASGRRIVIWKQAEEGLFCPN